MANTNISSAPMINLLGTQDLSPPQPSREPTSVPQHLPKFFLYAEMGPTTPQLVSGVELQNMYGINSFDYSKPYANHSTVFIQGVNGVGNQMMLQRVIPDDAGPNSNIILWLDVLPTNIPNFLRNSDGSIMLNNLGIPVSDTTTPTINGYSVKWVATNRTTLNDLSNVGSLSIVPGDQTDPVSNVQSQRYPIFEIVASSQGARGNLTGIRLWAPVTTGNTSAPQNIISTEKVYPYYFSVISSPDKNTSPTTVPNIFGDAALTISFKPGAIDPVTGASLYFGDLFPTSYQNLSDPINPITFGDFNNLAIYDNNISTLLTMFYNAEVPHINQFSDISATDATTSYLFNFISGRSSYNVPYTSFVMVQSANTVNLTSYSNVMAMGGSDGTMTDANFANSVTNIMASYLDPNNPVQETAVNVESIMYDTGFPLATKLALCSFIGVRKDTIIALSTHDVNQPQLTSEQEYSLAVALKTRLQMYPESEYFGTDVMRGIIIGRSGLLRNSQFKKPVPLLYELAIKAGTYMGAANGAWVSGQSFDSAPGNIVENLYNLNITFTPSTVRNLNWSTGLNWAQAYDLKSQFIPAFKTVYDNDGSVLNSFPVALAICTLNKIAMACWREFTGVESLTNAQLTARVNSYINAKVQGIFDNRYHVVPAAFFTDTDLSNGNSWTVPIKLYAPNMMTVMTSYVQAYNINSFPTTQAV